MSPYSTLEVKGVEGYHPYCNGETDKEVIQHDSVYPQLAAFETDRGYLPEVLAHESVYPSYNPPAVQDSPQQQPQQPASRIWGLPKRTFYILLIIGVVIIAGALAGGIGGGLAAKQHRASSASDTNGTQGSNNNENGNGNNNNNDNDNDNGNNNNNNNNVNILSISQLTASNRTDVNGHAHRTVFFQDPSSALIARRWDSANASWTTANLTALTRAATSNALDLGLAPGASLASASLTYGNKSETHVWFAGTAGLESSVVVRSLMLMDPDAAPDAWEYDEDVEAANLQVLEGSRMAAAWQRCWRNDTVGGDEEGGGCLGAWTLAYQDPDGDVYVGNGTGWKSPAKVVEARSVARNTSLGLVAQVENGGRTSVSRVILVSESLGTGEVGDMQKMMYTGGDWISDNSLIKSLPAPSPNLQFAMTVQKNFSEQTTMALLPNGTVTALLWDGRFHAIPSINFRGGPDVNFTSIAASEDAMIYGISGDEILQYEPDQTDIYSYVYVGRVYP
ncbi:uncharacterized protein F4807DRAFT_3791 [Annulohypoxylon truncatum]|uniref:uncharacterized protein n=1 Tax=Annulohypoxylon truncatum TaxID=327061 RepID=UPI002008062A|nr:uncharacterized protein F4807DRAFT_3791 [Annulohypoxylon truncatum]KAI1214626.1 hypothetical protein F4807DRAFT_3791 [Annulohypoxylon truncatum]